MEFIGTHGDGERFVKVLTECKVFRDSAEASHLNGQKKLWLENIILGSDDSQKFDELCQQVNKKLLDFHLEAAKDGKSLHHKIFEMLQSQTFQGIIPHETSLAESPAF